ncbi:MAG: type I-E CRISPR-associated protein Cas5/CasD [Methanosarcina sp.]
MVTLLLRLSGPLQAWGTDSKFETRNTQREPSKSGVIGMIAAAMGRGRNDPIADISSLKYGVRIDQKGTIIRDYHTAHHPTDYIRAFVTNRFYLENGCFLVGLEGEEKILGDIDFAIKHPFYPLYLGRRSCPPSGQISLGLRDEELFDALRNEPWQASEWYRVQAPRKVSLEIVCDSVPGRSSMLVRDCPVSFSQERRSYGFRGVERILAGKVIENGDSTHRAPEDNKLDAIAEVMGEDK